MKTGNTDDTLEVGGGGLSEGGVSSSVVKGLLLLLSSARIMGMICSKRPSSSAHLFPRSNITGDWILNFADNLGARVTIGYRVFTQAQYSVIYT